MLISCYNCHVEVDVADWALVWYDLNVLSIDVPGCCLKELQEGDVLGGVSKVRVAVPVHLNKASGTARVAKVLASVSLGLNTKL